MVVKPKALGGGHPDYIWTAWKKKIEKQLQWQFLQEKVATMGKALQNNSGK